MGNGINASILMKKRLFITDQPMQLAGVCIRTDGKKLVGFGIKIKNQIFFVYYFCSFGIFGISYKKMFEKWDELYIMLLYA